MMRRSEPDQLPGILTGDSAADDVLTGSEEESSGENAEPKWMSRSRHSLYRHETTPLWMRADLARLEATFPAFSFAIRRGLRGFTIEAWRDPAAGGLYAVITDNPRELWQELEMAGR